MGRALYPQPVSWVEVNEGFATGKVLCTTNEPVCVTPNVVSDGFYALEYVERHCDRY